MIDRRSFLHHTMLTGIGLSVLNPGRLEGMQPISENTISGHLTEGGSVTDEKYWKKIRGMFHVPEGFINLENGYFSPQPKHVLALHQQREHYINQNTSWFMRREQSQAIESSREALAKLLGCSPLELALTRNTTESMNIVINGYPWQRGDEVVIGNQDYGSMVSAYHQASKRYGIVIKVAEIPLHPGSAEEVIKAYSNLFNAKTRVVHLTHLINLSGQVIPVAAIATAAKVIGAEVIVDSAHSVAHLKFLIPDLNADYIGASLHKWLCNPLGAGFLWMKKEHIHKIHPLTADDEYPTDDIKKFEHQGTRPIQTIETIAASIGFHEAIGSLLKQERLRYLMRYWVKQVDGIPKIKINTPYAKDEECGAIANIAIDGLTPAELADRLLTSYSIFTVAIDHPAIQGVRVTPHLYNSLEELDSLVTALKTISA